MPPFVLTRCQQRVLATGSLLFGLLLFMWLYHLFRRPLLPQRWFVRADGVVVGVPLRRKPPPFVGVERRIRVRNRERGRRYLTGDSPEGPAILMERDRAWYVLRGRNLSVVRLPTPTAASSERDEGVGGRWIEFHPGQPPRDLPATLAAHVGGTRSSRPPLVVPRSSSSTDGRLREIPELTTIPLAAIRRVVCCKTLAEAETQARCGPDDQGGRRSCFCNARPGGEDGHMDFIVHGPANHPCVWLVNARTDLVWGVRGATEQDPPMRFWCKEETPTPP